jgi:hypothetical protein
MLYFPSRTMHDDGPDALEGAICLAQEMPAGGATVYKPVKTRHFQAGGAF